MTRLETSFFLIDGDLIVVDAVVTGPRRKKTGSFVLDTGAALTTLAPSFVDAIGYGPRDGFRRTSVRTAISKEIGYALRLADFATLGFRTPNLPVNVFDLGFDDLDGLVGMNFLRHFNVEIRCAERRILTEQTAR
jgi:predicted aspartyl protease